MIKAVIFDLDDTLYDEEMFVLGGFRAVAQFLQDRHGLNSEVLYSRMVQLLSREGRGKIFDVILAENGIDGLSVEQMVDVYRSHRPCLKLYPDAENVLKQLKGRVHLGIITDGNTKVQWNKIRALGLDKIVELVIVTDDLGPEYCKLSPVPYQLVMEKLKLDGKNIVYIGDNPNKDFITARQLGWRTIRICRPKGMFSDTRLDCTREADCEIGTLNEITASGVISFADN